MTSWARVKDEQTVEPKWAHVEEEPETNGEIETLCASIDKSFDSYQRNGINFDHFGYLKIDKQVGIYLYALSKMQKCMGELSEIGIEASYENESFDVTEIESIMGQMLYYMEAMMMTSGIDLSDAADQCKHLCGRLR